MMVYPTMAYPASIRGVGVGFNRAVTGVAQAIALFVLPIWMAGYKTDVYLIISIFAFIPLIVIGLLIKFEPTAQDVDVVDEDKTELPLNNSPVIDQSKNKYLDKDKGQHLLAFVLRIRSNKQKLQTLFYSIYHCFRQPQGLHCLLDMDRVYPSATPLVLSIFDS